MLAVTYFNLVQITDNWKHNLGRIFNVIISHHSCYLCVHYTVWLCPIALSIIEHYCWTLLDVLVRNYVLRIQHFCAISSYS